MKIQLTRSVQELLYSISARNTTFFRKFMGIFGVEIFYILKATFVDIVQISFRRLLSPAASRGCAEPSAPPRLLCAALSAAHKKPMRASPAWALSAALPPRARRGGAVCDAYPAAAFRRKAERRPWRGADANGFGVREALNKSRHASCLHIFRNLARKLLEIHQVFLRRFHTITGGGFRLRKICLRNLHTRFNQHFPRTVPAALSRQPSSYRLSLHYNRIRRRQPCMSLKTQCSNPRR